MDRGAQRAAVHEFQRVGNDDRLTNAHDISANVLTFAKVWLTRKTAQSSYRCLHSICCHMAFLSKKMQAHRDMLLEKGGLFR